MIEFQTIFTPTLLYEFNRNFEEQLLGSVSLWVVAAAIILQKFDGLNFVVCWAFF